jgi:hypothetical protein
MSHRSSSLTTPALPDLTLKMNEKSVLRFSGEGAVTKMLA